MKIRRALATVLTIAMLIGIIPANIFASAEEPVANDGIVFTKTAQANGDGTVDITMEAYTTGKVTNSQSAVPADIVLVLDMSGSMDDEAAHSPHGIEILGTTWTSLLTRRYGFQDTDATYYILDDENEYVEVTFVDYDDSGLLGSNLGHQYYTDGVNYYYPKLSDGVSTNSRTQSYEEKQFFRNMTHMEILKEGASAFIADVAAKNAMIENDDDKHRVSIVKFATSDYYNGSAATDDYTQAVVGDNKNSSDYNYTQVVKDFTVVDDAGKTELITALNNMTSGGATAVDYGLQLAEKILGDRENSVGRSEAVIVFTDGSPTHSSDYEDDVAGAAINEALALKSAGVKIFSIGGADTADSSVLGDDSNRFMHYISNNYPTASYTDETITANEGSIDNGFYMTPSDDRNLEQIFDDIFKQTVELDITLGETAGVVDTISPYFTIPGDDIDAQKANITVQTVRKTANGWDDTQEALDADVYINGNTLTVRGFDFDKNYVSTTPRQVGGSDFYGRKLVITINNLEPDYDEIDMHKVSFVGGEIPTNDGYAAVVNSANEVVMTAASPTVTAKTVTYKVDDQDYAYFYRLPGETVDVIDDEPEKEGHIFKGWDRTGSFVMPNDNVVINAMFDKNYYTVTYVYSGFKPNTASELPLQATVPYGNTVTVAAPATASGYHFVGWNPRQEDLTINTINPGTPEETKQFTMPANNVTLIGYFMPGDDTAYTIEHYTETFTDGKFELKETEKKFGETDKDVTATPLTFTGFTFDATVPGTVITDTVEGDGSTVLKLYYTRNEYDIVYEFDGNVPIGVTEPAKVTKKYGESYTIEEAIEVAGYDFLGWYYTSDLTYTNVSGNTITVDRDVYLAGEFTAESNTQYTVEHWIQNISDSNYTRDDSLTERLTGTTDTDVTAYARILEGRVFNETETGNNLPADQTLDTGGTNASITANVDRNGNTVIRFYYDRIKYTVTYKYEGTVPTAGVIDPTTLTQANVPYGATVLVDTTVPNGQMPTGYVEFYGWYRGAAIDANLVTTFTMPARDVELLGYFIPDDNTPYIVKHFLQNADGSGYTEDEGRRETLYGETLKNVEAVPLLTILGMGYTYNSGMSTATGQIIAVQQGQDPLILSLYYDRIEYPVIYQYINAPAGAPPAPTDSDSPYRHGEAVEFLPAPTAVSGYTFHGWHVQDESITSTNDGFIMPKRAPEAPYVVVYGAWTPNSNTGYKVEHYYENLPATPGDAPTWGDGNGGVLPKFTETQHTGTTGHRVRAAEIPVQGFTLDTSIAGTLAEATIAGDGSTTLKLYYKRNVYKVTYVYSGTIPSAAFGTAANAQLPNSGAAYELKHGETHVIQPVVNMTADPVFSGYSFHGWTLNDDSVVITTSGTDRVFVMPTKDVILSGHFHPNNDTPYTINHFLEKEDGGYPTVPNYTEKRPGDTDAEASVYARKFDGFELDTATTAADVDTAAGETFVHDGDYYIITKEISGTGSTVFNFWYSRINYNVTYEFDGVQPHGIDLSAHQATMSTYNHTAKYGTTVDVKRDLYEDGYVFEGWHSDAPTVGNNDLTFTMPNKAVVLKGRFTARNDTQYKVQYYLQKLNAEETAVAGTNKATDYELKDEYTFNNGTTGHTATAEIKHYDGFAARGDNVISKTIAGDGSTVIDVYYDRVTNPITYHFYGAHPDHQESELPPKEENVPYGAKRSVADNIICDSTHRHVPTGWASPHVAATAGEEFRMPATKVDFYTALRHIYKVEYDLNGGIGASGVAYTPFDVFAGTVIDVKPAPTKNSYSFTGWKLDGTDTIYSPDDEIAVDKDIKLVAQYRFNGGGVVVTSYTLTYETNGGNAIGKETYISGTDVKLTKVPVKDGYVFEGWYLDEELTENVTEVKMTKNITVYAAWVEDNGGAGTGHDTPDDLNGEDHFAYVLGYPDGTVRPNANISRAEVTAIFFRLLKPDEVRDNNLTDNNNFSDVNNGDWYNTPISTMANLGIVNGRYADRFAPNEFITRAEFATICARFDNSEFEIVDEFTDVQGHWAEAEIHEAAAHGWIRGYEDGTFRPDQFITRAEAMTMINRVLNRVPETADDLLDGMIVWPDNNDKSAWYYLAVQEATNSHDYEMKNHIYEKWTNLREVTDWTKYE